MRNEQEQNYAPSIVESTTESKEVIKKNDQKPHIDKKKLLLKILLLFSPIILFTVHHVILYGIYTFPDALILALFTFSPLLIIAVLYIVVITSKSWGSVTFFQACTIAISSIPVLLMFFYSYGFSIFSKDEIVGEVVLTITTIVYLIAVIIYFMIDSYRIVKKERGSFSVKKTRRFI